MRQDRYPENGRLEYILTWNGYNDFGKTVASGTYFYQVIIDNQVLTKKIVFLK